MFFLRKYMNFEQYITKVHFDNLGKLLLVLSLIWTYINMVELFTGWYGGTSTEGEALRYRLFGYYAPAVLGDDPVLRRGPAAADLHAVQNVLCPDADPVHPDQHRHVHGTLPDRRDVAVAAVPAGCLGALRTEPGRDFDSRRFGGDVHHAVPHLREDNSPACPFTRSRRRFPNPNPPPLPESPNGNPRTRTVRDTVGSARRRGRVEGQRVRSAFGDLADSAGDGRGGAGREEIGDQALYVLRCDFGCLGASRSRRAPRCSTCIPPAAGRSSPGRRS